MKLIFKSAILGVITAIILTSAYAGVECKAHHAKGKTASAKAMKACAHHAKHAKHSRAHKVKEHMAMIEHHRVDAEIWSCTTMNARSERYEAVTAGRENAVEHAMHHCAVNSASGSNCALLGCVERK